MRFVIVTGMSGAGKASVLKMLEDAGYFCVDNMPVRLITKFAEMAKGEYNNEAKIAIGIDMRSGENIDAMEEVLSELDKMGIRFEVLFMDCEDKVLIKRFKETRRNHPLAGKGRVENGIKIERQKLVFLRSKADCVIDTTQMLIRELKQEVEKIFIENKEHGNIFVTVLSFGFKYGIPADADLVFDVRFLPNPYYVDKLKEKTGNDKRVKEFVLASEEGQTFLQKLSDMVEFLIPKYAKEGKNQLVIAVGCTGGKHRSVAVANALFERLSLDDADKKIEHRDIHRDSKKK